MSCIQILQGTATWLPFIATDVGTGTPRTGITFNLVNVSYKKSTQSVFTSKVLTAGDFRENGAGVYEILFSAAELDTLGSFIYVVVGDALLPAPAIRQFVGTSYVQSAASYTPGTVALPTNVITGNLIDLHGTALVGESISARIVGLPEVLGTLPNLANVGTDIVAAQTDAGGFFALELLQGSVVDIVIPVTGYRRTLTVPANGTDNLFDIP